MIYNREKINSFIGVFVDCSVVVLVGSNYNLLQRDAKKISDIIAGPDAAHEMRITKYFNQEINGKTDEILSSLRTKSFFPGQQIIMLNDMSEKDYKIILEIDSAWQNQDALTIVTMQDLSNKSELRKLLGSSKRMALVNYTKKNWSSEFLTNKLAEEGISFESEEVSKALTEFSDFTSEGILENELEKIRLYKLYDRTPIKKEDFFDIVSIDYEANELKLAVALAERDIPELEKNLNMFFSLGKNPISILQFLYAYFHKLSLIKLYGPTSYEARREYPFLFADDLETAKVQVKRWSTEQLNRATDSISVSNLKLRQYSSLFQRSILTRCLHKVMEF